MIELTPIEPIGKRTAVTLHGDFEMDDYPPSPRGVALRGLRVGLDLGVREASRKLGLTAVNLSRLETGKATCDWAKARALLLAGAPPLPARLRRSEWRAIARAVLEVMEPEPETGPNGIWRARGERQLLQRLVRRGLATSASTTWRVDLTNKAMDAFRVHPGNWGEPDAPRNCNLRRRENRS